MKVLVLKMKSNSLLKYSYLRVLLFFFAAYFLLSVKIFAKNLVIEYQEGYKIDWSSLVVRFYGNEISESSPSFIELEEKAITNALSRMKTFIPTLQQSFTEKASVKAHKSTLERASYVTRAEFFMSSGKYKVTMQSALSNIFQISQKETADQTVETAEVNALKNTGLYIVSLDKVRPSAVFKVVDEKGVELFGVRNISYKNYQKKLMGRWYINPSKDEVLRSAGSEPYVLKVKPISPAVFFLERKIWESAKESIEKLLLTGNIIIGIPQLL